MSEQWRKTTLGEVCAITIGRTPSRAEPKFWTTDLTHPFCTIADMGEREIAPAREGVTPLAIAEGKAKRVPAGALLMSFKLSIGRVGFAARDLYPNEAIAWLRSVDAELDERFLALWLSAQDLTAGSGRAVKGATLNSESLRAIEVAVPTPDVQRRIVDVIGAVDRSLAALRVEVTAMRRTLDAALTRWYLDADGGETARFGDLCVLRSGPSWSAAEESKEPSPGACRVVKITNTRPDGSIDMTDRTFVTGLPKSVSLLSDTSLILIRTNGNRGRIGNVYRPVPEALGCAVSAFQFSGEAVTREDRDWLYWLLSVPAMQSAMSEAASGTTGLGNLSASWLKDKQVPIATQDEQVATTERFDAMERHVEALDREHHALKELRETLLTRLLTGSIGMPLTYDDLIGAVA